MLKILKKIIPKRFTSRIFWLIFGLFFIIITLSFTRNLIYTINKSVHLYLYRSSVEFKDNMQNAKDIINKSIFLSYSLSKDFKNIYYLKKEQRREYLSKLMINLLEENHELLACWAITKPYTIDSLDNTYKNEFVNYNGAFIRVFYRVKYNIYQDTLGMNLYSTMDKYINEFLREKTNIIINAPEKVEYSLSREAYKISIISPIYRNKRIIGVLGLDVPVSIFAQYIGQKSYNYWILSANDFFIYSSNKDEIGHNIKNFYIGIIPQNTYFMNYVEDKGLLKKYTQFFIKNQTYYLFFDKVTFLNADAQWLYVILIPKTQLLKNKLNENLLFFIPYLSVLVVFIVLLLIVVRLMSIYNERILYQLDLLSKGEYRKVNVFNWKTIDMMELQEKVSSVMELFMKAASITEELNKGNYQVKIERTDKLFGALEQLRQTLSKTRETQQKYIETQKIERWHTEAINKVNEIIRQYPKKEEFSQKILLFLIEYIDAVQGGFFVREKENQQIYFSLIAFYSYGREVYHRKKISLGEGLIGSCAIEKKSIFTEVPDNYIEITSGLGKAKPNYLFLSPFLHENEVYGIIELTFLRKPDPKVFKLLEEVSFIIGATLSSIEISEHTQKLLEEAKKKEVLLKLREQEVQRALEHIKQLQEEKKENKEKIRSLLNGLNDFVFVVEFDKNLNVIYINKRFLSNLGIAYSSALSSDYYLLLGITEIVEHQKYINNVLSGQKLNYEFNIQSKDKKIWIHAILSPILGEENEVKGFYFLGIDNTEVIQLRQQIEQLNVIISEQKEQLSIQELEFDNFAIEIEELNNKIEEKEKEIQILIEEKEKLEKSLEFFKKELQKRVKRSKKIEQNLKHKNTELNERIIKLEEELRKYKKK